MHVCINIYIYICAYVYTYIYIYIYKDLGLQASDYCVLKLCNRQRGAGVMPIRASVLDEVFADGIGTPDPNPKSLVNGCF